MGVNATETKIQSRHIEKYVNCDGDSRLAGHLHMCSHLAALTILIENVASLKRFFAI